MRRLGWSLLVLAPLLLVPALFLSVLKAGAIPLRATLPHEEYRPDRCTWSCHDHGCRHRPLLPAFIAGDEGLFGSAIQSLGTLGGALIPGERRLGYGAANLLVFCVVWPGAMYMLYVIALRQRRRLRQRSAESGR